MIVLSCDDDDDDDIDDARLWCFCLLFKRVSRIGSNSCECSSSKFVRLGSLLPNRGVRRQSRDALPGVGRLVAFARDDRTLVGRRRERTKWAPPTQIDRTLAGYRTNIVVGHTREL